MVPLLFFVDCADKENYYGQTEGKINITLKLSLSLHL